MDPTPPTAVAPTSTPTTMNTIPNPTRFIPYAKDHDRLQIALLYIENECNRYSDTVAQLESLRRQEGTIQRSLKRLSAIREANIKQYIQSNYPAKYLDSTGHEIVPDFGVQTAQGEERSKKWGDNEMEHVFMIEKREMKELAHVLERIEVIEAQQKLLSEHASQKEEILKLIEELHATAFDGKTPEFPHEDQLEALVEVAQVALKGEQAVLDKLEKENGLVELEKVAHSAQSALENISVLLDEIYTNLTLERPIAPGVFLLKEFWKFKVPEQCKVAAQMCQAWKKGVDNHFLEHPGTILSPRARGELPQIDSKELMEVFSRAASTGSSVQHAKDRSAALLNDARQARSEIRATNSAVGLMKDQARKSIAKARTMLDLRRRQLTAARSQILDHVVDPEQCPLEQRSEQLPEYPEHIMIHDLPESHPLVPRLLAESETYSIGAYVGDIVNSRLSRARRTTYPPVLLPSRYQPPIYDELEDQELLSRRYRRDVPPVEGDAPEYNEQPDYKGITQTDTNELRPTTQKELEELVSKARKELGLKSKAQQDRFNDMMRTVMNILEGTSIPFIMTAPGV